MPEHTGFADATLNPMPSESIEKGDEQLARTQISRLIYKTDDIEISSLPSCHLQGIFKGPRRAQMIPR